VGLLIGEPDHRTEAVFVVPGRYADDGYVRTQLQFSAPVDARWDVYRTTAGCSGIDRALEGFGIVAFAIALGPELADIEDGFRHVLGIGFGGPGG
jgi:hypothetical protein